MKKYILLFFLSIGVLQVKAQKTSWDTYYEKSNYKETPRYEETISYCKKIARHAESVTFKAFGKSPRYRDLPLMIFNNDGNFTVDEVKQNGDLVVLIEACIHAGEPDGKDAGLMLLRDIAIHNKYTEFLDQITILFIPILNPDGHERFGPYNRINQNGPEQMGWRTNAQNLNLNRDFLKADAPETKHWLKIFNKWIPDFFIDIHTTDGADYQYPLTYAMETFGNMDKGLTQWQKDSYLEPIKTRMSKEGYPIFPYISFREWHNPESGLVSWAAKPRLSQGYTALQNRPGLLIETHMLKDYKTRVAATYKMLKHTLKLLNEEHKTLKNKIRKADAYAASKAFREQPFAVNFKTAEDCTMITFKGIEYKKVQSKLTGSTWFQYGHETKTFEIPYFNNVIPTAQVNLPICYIIPPEWKKVTDRIVMHGIQTDTLKETISIHAESTKFTNVTFKNTPYEGRQRVEKTDMKTFQNKQRIPQGSIIVPMNQRRARVIAHMLEPQAPDSFLKWGFFNAIFEQKEYAELYVMEEMAREMMAKDSTLRKKFETKKKKDPEFANSPWAISNWFYRRTPYWDDEKNSYPVLKLFSQKSYKKILKKVQSESKDN